MDYTPAMNTEGFLGYPAPAKLNLFLHIVGRRADGYHLLQSVFQLVDLCDTVWLKVDDSGEIVRNNPLPGVPAESDLIWRAAKLLQTRTGCRKGVALDLDKRIPMGGGMGGGSSDAATVLLALNRLWGLNLPRNDLMALGLELGADVPFFIYGRNAFVEGIGEIMTPVETEPGWFVVLHPPVHVPTLDIFRAPDLTRDSPPIKVRDLAATDTRNDMEPVACRLYPQIAEHVNWLNQYAAARMTGSGSCVFSRHASQDDAKRVILRLPDSWRGFVAAALEQHPLREFAAD
ncbi:4-diphosphocytidyl-2-C-methyl-D-erythritol kinase [Formivibrio citricus]|uniref:4-diphosphocytidyl-2-C-methyl-D-erythritol kinase n=1 Tax=Formivibrio citricus TaxID=83765 RepID=A0A1I5DED7_9NEIS|nr:4-(cytidine 5'-diphospho)-2-C-methyl-D-erythritol kinase [Formivibrio citricus]SFN97615.1 4-diphosphocytidyl-2-C-methyl-D-erythritol kinase [Formivibrio citricus]